MQQRLPSLLEHPIAFAHRGARAHARENTIDAFELALRLGASGLESDVWLTADGIAVLDHDGVARVRRRKRSIRELRREQLPSHIPTLAELFERCGTDYDLSLDLKDDEVAPSVVGVVREVAPDIAPRVWLCHPRYEALVPLRPLAGDIKLVDSTRLQRIREGPERRAAILADRGIDGVNMHYSDWNGGLVTLFHRFDRAAFGWDMQHEHILRPALRMGLDGVFSDHVDVMVAAYRAELGSLG
ncbi:MAG: glycerophosphodiester phosphodiesterase [Ilumatobacteraceae bacterium]